MPAGNTNFSFVTENLRILKIAISYENYYLGKNEKFQVHFSQK